MSWLKCSQGAQASEESSLNSSWPRFFFFLGIRPSVSTEYFSSSIWIWAQVASFRLCQTWDWVWLYPLYWNVEVFIRKWCNVNIWWPKGSQVTKSAWDLPLRCSKYLHQRNIFPWKLVLGMLNDAKCCTKSEHGLKMEHWIWAVCCSKC